MGLVSVVMPTYDAHAWVAETIDNLIAQTYPDVELIVVDDASRDDTVRIVREKLSADFRGDWKIIELGVNGGPSAARNVGLREARGEWVQFLDSDDLMAPEKFELQMAICLRAADDVSAVYSPWRQCHIDGGRVTPIGRVSYPQMEGRHPIMCLVGNDRPLHAAGLARRSTLLEIGGWDETLRFWECEEVTFRLAKRGRLVAAPSPTPLYFWRQHEKPYFGGDEARYQTAAVALSWIAQLLKALDHKPLDAHDLSAADRRAIGDYSTYLARILFRQDRAAFRRYLTQARRLDPAIVPTYPAAVSMLAGRLGYEAAESVADLGRAPAALARRLLHAVSAQPGAFEPKPTD